MMNHQPCLFGPCDVSATPGDFRREARQGPRSPATRTLDQILGGAHHPKIAPSSPSKFGLSPLNCGLSLSKFGFSNDGVTCQKLMILLMVLRHSLFDEVLGCILHSRLSFQNLWFSCVFLLFSFKTPICTLGCFCNRCWTFPPSYDIVSLEPFQ